MNQDDYHRIITAPSEWAQDLPIPVKGWESRRYTKIAADASPAPPEREQSAILEEPDENLSAPDDNLGWPDDDINLDGDDTMFHHKDFNRDGYPNGDDSGDSGHRKERPGRGPSFIYLDEHGQPSSHFPNCRRTGMFLIGSSKVGRRISSWLVPRLDGSQISHGRYPSSGLTKPPTPR